MEYVIPAAVVVSACVGAGLVWLRRRREAPLRRVIRAQNVTFRTGDLDVRLKQPSGWLDWLPLNSFMALFVRGDGIEISSLVWPFRVVMGMEYYFRARETTIQVRRAPSRPFEPKWMVVTGRQLGKEVMLAISANSAYQLCQAWNAMVDAGAVPVGPPPGGDGAGRWVPRLSG